MKPTILLPVIAVCTFAQVEQGFGAIMAEWHQFNTTTPTFPVSATSPDASISSAVMDDPVNLTKFDDDARFRLRSWNTGSTVDTFEYLELSLNIDPDFTVSFSDLKFTARYNDGGLTVHVRSSADNFASDLTGYVHNPDGSVSAVSSFSLTGEYIDFYTVDLSSLANQSGTVGFRFYGTDAGDSTISYQAKDNPTHLSGGGIFEISGTATAVPEPSFYAGVSGLGLLAFAFCRRLKRGQAL